MNVCNPLVSVIMPVYNGEKFLHHAINSILNQTYKYFEFLIINDGSTDSTEEIVLSYTDSRIIYIKNEQNLKLIKTLNKGIELAKGEYIARMDADDISLPLRFERQINLFVKSTYLSVVSVFPINIDSNGETITNSSFFSCTMSESLRFVALFETPILHPGVMIKSNILKKYKYDDCVHNLHIEAYALWTKLLYDGLKCIMIKDYLLKYRNNENSICSTFAPLQLRNQVEFSSEIIAKELNTFLPIDVHLAIIQKREFNNIDVLINSIISIEDIKRAYLLKNISKMSVSELHEINSWCRQRKLAIILNSLLNGHKRIKRKAFFLFLQNIDLLFYLQNIYYIKNRLRKILKF